MKPSTSSYFAKLAVMNVCSALLLGMGYTGTSSADMSSEAEQKQAAQAAVREQGEQVAPVIEHALDTVQQSNNSLQSLFGAWFSSPSTISCADCEKQIARMRYPQCSASDKNGYLEKQLDESASQPTLLGALIRRPLRPDSIIKPICMKMSMEIGQNLPRSNFKSCNKDGYGSSVGAACVSEDYFKLVNNSFDLVSKCMKDFIADGENDDMKKLDVRAVYALINIESGFHINAVSGTGAGGIGQFTSAAIADVNMNELPAVKKSLATNPHRICGRMSDEFLKSAQPIRNSSSKSCDRISLKNGNPVKNMIYTFAYLKGAKADMDRGVFNNKQYAKKFSKLSAYDIAKIRRAMMVWSHNTGSAGTLTPAKALLNIVYRNKPVTNADTFINQLQQYMQKFPARANAKSARRKETSGYFPAITDRLHKIETYAGGGSCVN
ncbi:MAG TPA: transglycosylase SLT domain-containing protein [Bdellovibrio sp.]|uniref:transglycosylase SLT domain-containing protein n=1 Tax=Bdellovibrio sp. TaxID=28201 RepID=UPI002F006E65